MQKEGLGKTQEKEPFTGTMVTVSYKKGVGYEGKLKNVGDNRLERAEEHMKGKVATHQQVTQKRHMGAKEFAKYKTNLLSKKIKMREGA